MSKPWKKPISIFLSWAIFVFTFPITISGQEDETRTRQTELGGVTVEQTLSGQGELAVAILDLEGRGISALEAQTLTDRMRSELVKTGAVTVVERGQMQEVLEEQGFQQTGCTSAECAVEVGKLLGVSQMVTGAIGKIGQSYTIDIRLFSVESGAITRTVNSTYKGEIDGLIMEVEKMAWQIVELAPPTGRFPGEEPAVAAAPPQQEQPVQVEKEKPKKKKRGRGLLLLTLAAAAVGGGAYFLIPPPPEEEALPGPPTLP